MRKKQIRIVIVLAAAALLLAVFAGARFLGQKAERDLVPSLPAPDEAGAVTVGTRLKAPLSSGTFSMQEYTEALAANGYYYATWTSGEASQYTSSDGEEALLYPAQIYMVVYEGTDEADAASRAAGWISAAEQQYAVTETAIHFPGTAANMEYTLLSYEVAEETSPYAGGISAFSSSGNTAFCMELQYTSDWEGDPASSMKTFLEMVTE